MQSEKTLQLTLVSMLKNLYPDYVLNLSLSGISLNGSAKENAQTMYSMVQQGFERGMVDLLLYLPNGKVLNMELKTDKGKQSTDQIDVQHRLAKLGHNYYVIRTVYEAFNAIAEHTTESDRLEQRNKLIIHHDGKSLTKPFLHFAVGTNLSTVQDTLKNLYHL
jgi:hypothetical protein